MSQNPSTILGISFCHGDSSAALIKDGVLLAAAEEERFTRIKHYALYPEKAISYCLDYAGLAPRDVNVVAIAKKPGKHFFKKLSFALAHPGVLRGRKQPGSKIESLPHFLERMGLGRARISRTEHHEAHLWSARYLENESSMALLSLDGLGDFVSCTIAKAEGADLDILDRVFFPHSLGFFYTAMTQYLGFPHFGDEFKVMGLSSLGKPTLLPVMRELVREDSKFGFRLNLEAFPLHKRPRTFYIEEAQPKVHPLYQVSLLTQMLGISPRKPAEKITEQHANLAMSVQARFEEVANHVLKQLHERFPTSILGLAGGCAHNSVWVGKIPNSTPFKKVLVAPASHDAGIAVGAAIHASRVPVTAEGGSWSLLGPSESYAKTVTGLTEKTFSNEQKLIQWLSDEIAEGKIIGLAKGRMEFGPRALGNRSILADPRVAAMKEKLNARVKHRESFRPFAASVLEEYQDQWFEEAFYSPTMEAVFPVKGGKKKQIPGVVHNDGSCRIQSVRKSLQPFYWSLIEAFRKKTGIPMLINTSFNDCEPIVKDADDALRCFENCDMDILVVGGTAYLPSSKLSLVG